MMKFTPVILLLCATCFLFSCKKVKSFATGTGTGVLLRDAGGDCLAIHVAGSYVVGAPLIASNYIEVQVNYDSAAVYQISSDTVNGFYFHGQGYIEPDTHTIRLQGHGIPELNETDVFTVTLNATSCTANVTVP